MAEVRQFETYNEFSDVGTLESSLVSLTGCQLSHLPKQSN